MIANSILELIGHTPMLRLRRLPPSQAADILVKLEFLNPGGSIKDRLALGLIEDAEAQGRLGPGDTIVEASGGNTGISLALVAAAKGYPLILALPETVNAEHRQLLLQLGAQVVLTPAAKGMAGAGERAQQLAARNGYFQPQPFTNPATVHTHRKTTAQEIMEDTQGRIDAFVAGMGTGGTITGVGEVLREAIPGVLIVAVEPARSPLLSQGRTGSHNIPGIGPNFIPPVLNREIIHEVISVEDEEAKEMALALAREEGLVVGLSSGANVFAALKVAQRLGKGKTVVTLLPDTGERPGNLALMRESPVEITRRRR